MLRTGAKFIFNLAAVFTLMKCIDPYTPKLNGFESFLVVEGMITDENTSFTVKLSRTLQEQNATPTPVLDATVFITDDEAKSTSLKNIGAGKYTTESIEFQGIIGKTYILHIHIGESAEYESEPYTMQSVPEIDSIYFAKVQELSDNGTVNNQGIRIYLDSKEGNNNKYYRWDFEETWKFKVPSPKKYNYLNDTTILPVTDIKEYCWKFNKSNEVLINPVFSGQNSRIVKEPILFLDPRKSDRLRLQYSILIRQYSISKKEHDFWNSMIKINESGGDIFASQPFPVISNIYNVNNPNERVLGYFHVSAVKQKRKNIPFSEVAGLNLPFYRYPCVRIEMAPQDYPRASPYAPPLTWNGLYEMYCKNSNYYFVEPRYFQGTDKLDKLVFTKPECADCELTGTRTKPDFWIDLN
ncbi:MAG: DUF4249 domain-containing protein [Bacteroidetes bacterium]|nr:MAG: DUF4249 domain-containing protein [Bacteroidota bacterium]